VRPGALGVGQCCRRCCRCPQGHAAALCCLEWQRRRNGRADRRRRGRVHQGLDRVRRTAQPSATDAAPLPAGGRQSNSHTIMGRAARTRWRCSRRAAAPLAIASTTPALGCAHFVHPTSTRSPQQCTQRLQRWSCALAPARLSVEHDAPDLPLVSAHACVFCSAAPSRTARGDQHVSWPYVHYSGCTAKAPSRARSRTSRVVLQANTHMAANEEVRPLTVRVRVRSGARRRTWRYQLGAK
jgi:hypothetical protein